jgi:hypothetical protein
MMPDTDVVGCDIWTFTRDTEEWKDRLPSFETVITNREVITSHSEVLGGLRNLICFPILFFRAMHPDICHVHIGETVLQGPMMDYHSAIVIAAYKCGIPAESVPNLFCDENFTALGFYDLWNSDKQGLLEMAKQEGVDLRSAFLRWAREREPFMHSFNHPKINVIYDVARQVAISQDWSIRESPHRPHDNLALGPIFPVYPELANRLGLAGGSYSFKLAGLYDSLSLREFVDLSYAEYERHGRDALNGSSPQFARAMKLLAEAK